MRFSATLFVLLTTASLYTDAETTRYRSVLIDEKGQLHILLSSGGQILPQKLYDQVTFGEPLLSQDHRTVGWLAYYPYPGASAASVDPIPGRLVLYRSGHVLQSFPTGQIFWSWQFVNSDRDVAYCTGPTHGDAGQCNLRSIKSGRILAQWFPDAKVDPPAWAKDLRY